jgi:carboxyl-terminal processing protease
MRGFHLAATLVAAASMLAAAHAQEGRYGRLHDALWTTVKENFYDPHFRGTDWAAQRERYRARANAAASDGEFLAVAREMLGQINSSHLHISPPGLAGGAGIGARFTQMGDDLVVSQVAPLSDAFTQGLRPGDRLLSERDALRGELGSHASLRIRTCEGQRRTMNVRREHAFWPPEHPGFRWSQIRVGAERRIGYMRIDRFDDGAAALADRAMAELDGVDAIIIDVRNNSGGNVSALRLASYFGPGAEPAVILLARPYLQALGRPVTAADIAAAPRVDRAYTTEAVFDAMMRHNGGAAFWTDAIEQRFAGPVFVLISEETGSAGEGFAWYMRERTQAKLIGTQTQGALLSSESFDLGEGWSVTIPVHGNWGADGQDYGDRAAPPDETIAPTREDLCAGRDPVLAAALRQATG